MKGNIQIIIRIIILVLVITLSFLIRIAIIRSQPVASAQEWLKATAIADSQTATTLTCSSKISEVINIVNIYSRSIITEVDLSKTAFKIIYRENNLIVIDVSGQVYALSNGLPLPWDINQRWEFILEENKWKWCGFTDKSPTEIPNILSEYISIIVVGMAIIILLIISLISQRIKSNNDFSQFISPPTEESIEESINHVITYESGEIKSVNKYTGEGVIETEDGERYIINQNAIIGKGDNRITVGEGVLFQKNWESKEKKAKNIIKVLDQSKALSPYSTWLRRLANQTIHLRNNFRFYDLTYIQKELNTCKAFLDQLNDYATNHNIKLAAYEVVLTHVIDGNLNAISKKAEAAQNKSSLWSRIVNFIFEIINVLANFVIIASPSTALLLKSMSKGINNLLGGPKPPSSLGPGDKS